MRTSSPGWDERWGEALLERLQIAAQYPLDGQLVHAAMKDLTVTRDIYGQLVAALRAEVYAHRVDVQHAKLPVTGTVQYAANRHVLIELPRTRWQRWLRRPVQRLWVPFGMEVLHLPVVGGTLELESPDGPISCPIVGVAVEDGLGPQVDVVGLADVKAELFHTFPDNQISYPADLGPMKVLTRVGAPTGWRPQENWR